MYKKSELTSCTSHFENRIPSLLSKFPLKPTSALLEYKIPKIYLPMYQKIN